MIVKIRNLYMTRGRYYFLSAIRTQSLCVFCILVEPGLRCGLSLYIYILWHSLLVNGWMEGRGGDCFLPILSSWSTNSSSQTKYFLTFFAISSVICIFFPLLASFTGCLKHDLFQDIIKRCWEFHWYFDSVWRNDSWELRLMTKYSPDCTRMWGEGRRTLTEWFVCNIINTSVPWVCCTRPPCTTQHQPVLYMWVCVRLSDRTPHSSPHGTTICFFRSSPAS